LLQAKANSYLFLSFCYNCSRQKQIPIFFPQAIIGAMMFLVGLEMVKFARDIPFNWDISVLAVTVAVAVFTTWLTVSSPAWRYTI
jgi:hypothetical protein